MLTGGILGDYILGWLGLAVLMFINGIARVKLYGPRMKELTAHQVSTATGILLLYLTTTVHNRVWPIPDQRSATSIGALWLGLTVAFEFLFMHYVMTQPWEKLLHDYNIREGRVWSLFLVATALMPLIVYKLTF